jgi:hypothetical protein
MSDSRKRVRDAGRQHADDLRTIRRDRERRVKEMLHADIARMAPGNAAYWIGVVGGSFALNLLLLVLLAR